MNTNSDKININIPKILYFSLIGLVVSIAWYFFTDFRQDYDLWMHLFFGEHILATASIPVVDSWSFTANGSPIVNHEWLSQIIFSVFYQNFSDLGLIFLKFSLYFGICFCTWKLIAQKVDNLFARIIAIFLVILALRSGISFRMQMFSYFFLALITFLECSCCKGSEKGGGLLASYKVKAFFYPILFLLWANLHGAFVLGLGVLGVLFLDKLYRKEVGFTIAAIIVGGSFLATLLNPYGANLWVYIFHELTLSKSGSYITEWQSFSFQPRERAFLIMFLSGSLLGAISFGKQKLVHIFLFIIAAYLGFSAVRHSPLIVILGLPMFVVALQSVFQDQERVDNLPSKIFAGIFCLISLAIIFRPVDFKMSYHDELPVAAVSYIEDHDIRGNMIVPLHWGGYSLFNLAPEVKVSIDGRWATLYSEEVMDASYAFDYIGDNGRWSKIADELQADLLLVESINTIIPEITANQSWQLIYNDKIAHIFKRL